MLLFYSFRWDYVDQQKDKKALPGFRLMHKEGVRAKYVKTIFPSLSYACWTTLSKGEISCADMQIILAVTSIDCDSLSS